MCGIAGILDRRGIGSDPEHRLGRMLSSIRHRGPDQFGMYLGREVALGSARLSIIDLAAGQQPIGNEDGTLWIVYNGEVFNYVELRAELEQRGHRFATHTDTEAILHLYEELGPACLSRLNGQFAIAIWDTRNRTLFLARDRLGVRPLFYTIRDGALFFGSEIKAILNGWDRAAEIDPGVLPEVFAYWSPLSPHTAFRHIQSLPPGHYLLAGEQGLRVQSYWEIAFENGEEAASGRPRGRHAAEEHLEAFQALLIDATRIRLRADVPVGAYLSGGLDSSTIAAVIRNHTGTRLDTFSIAFTDLNFDESQFQRRMAAFLGTEHQVVEATHADIGRVFPEVIWHTEVPLTRTAPAPMFLLSGLVRKRGYKVVLTGEGADEFLGGYDIFKEAQVRRFWGRIPESRMRRRLLGRLYPDIFSTARPNDAFLAAFFGEGLTDLDAPYYSHAIRWRNNRRSFRFFTESVLNAVGGANGVGTPPIPAAFANWDGLARSQYLEIAVFLSEYLLCSQGDRVAMAHSVEGRFPFLDYRLVEFCNRLPADLKLRGLQEKFLLKRAARAWLPPEIWTRRKRPYRAPIHRSFFGTASPDYVGELLSPEALGRSGFFKPAAVRQLVTRLQEGRPIGETDDMALAGILSTQLLQAQFVDRFKAAEPLGPKDDLKILRAA